MDINQSSLDDGGNEDILDLIINLVQGILHNFSPPQNLRHLTYSEAIQYFIENKPNHTFECGAMLLEPAPEQQWYFTQLFLTSGNKLIIDDKGLPFGRRILINSLGDDLKALFQDRKIILVK